MRFLIVVFSGSLHCDNLVRKKGIGGFVFLFFYFYLFIYFFFFCLFFLPVHHTGYILFPLGSLSPS